MKSPTLLLLLTVASCGDDLTSQGEHSEVSASAPEGGQSSSLAREADEEEATADRCARRVGVDRVHLSGREPIEIPKYDECQRVPDRDFGDPPP
jgi:hypothetical protein